MRKNEVKLYELKNETEKETLKAIIINSINSLKCNINKDVCFYSESRFVVAFNLERILALLNLSKYINLDNINFEIKKLLYKSIIECLDFNYFKPNKDLYLCMTKDDELNLIHFALVIVFDSKYGHYYNEFNKYAIIEEYCQNVNIIYNYILHDSNFKLNLDNFLINVNDLFNNYAKSMKESLLKDFHNQSESLSKTDKLSNNCYVAYGIKDIPKNKIHYHVTFKVIPKVKCNSFANILNMIIISDIPLDNQNITRIISDKFKDMIISIIDISKK